MNIKIDFCSELKKNQLNQLLTLQKNLTFFNMILNY